MSTEVVAPSAAPPEDQNKPIVWRQLGADGNNVACVTNSEGQLGEAYIEITDAKISIESLLTNYSECSECGAVATFLGVTRNHFNEKRVVQLEYEAYSSMALHQLQKIASEVFHNFSKVHRVVISHRIGVVPVKEASVFIAVTTEHRQASLQAVSFAIDELKARVPIWKKEVYETADATEAAWKRNAESNLSKH